MEQSVTNVQQDAALVEGEMDSALLVTQLKITT
jgi:hypothetical protein